MFQAVIKSSRRWLIAGIAFSFVFVHSFPFLFFKQWTALGFDTGFYRRYLIEPFTSIPHAAVPGVDHTVIIPRLLLDMLRFTGLPTDVVLYGGYMLAAALMLGGVFFLVRAWSNTDAALLAVFLILFSPVYYHGYWSFLFKNVLALALFFWLLYALQTKRVALAFFFAFLIPITHQSTTIFVGMYFFSAALYGYFTKRSWHIPLGLWAVTLALYLLYHPTVAAKLAAPPTAIFMTPESFLWLAAPLLFLLFVVGRQCIAVLKECYQVSIPLCIVAVFTLGTLPYAERFLYTSIFFIGALASASLERAALPRTALTMYLFVYAAFGAYAMAHEAEVSSQLAMLSFVPGEAGILTPNYLAPWVHGYAVATVYAPGVFKDAATPAEWEFYWSHQSREYDRDFLNSYGSALYFFVPPGEAAWFLPSSDCVEQKTEYLYRYTCGVE
jgi:hypothetical protein